MRRQMGVKKDPLSMQKGPDPEKTVSDLKAPAPVFQSLLSSVKAAPDVDTTQLHNQQQEEEASPLAQPHPNTVPTPLPPGNMNNLQQVSPISHIPAQPNPQQPMQPAYQQQQMNYPAHSYQQPQQYVDQGYQPPITAYQAEAPVEVSGGKRRRMRDWELEAQLQQGGTVPQNALDQMGVIDLQAGPVDNYNPLRQGPSNQKTNVQIKAGFYNPRTGQVEQTVKPSRLQKRKHQINQLAFTAAERELELMERRGQQMRTKSQTQGKYGW
mmetsp:Transcript_18799/g.24274  ORF Transcript_18799/g.24274 Transcript_18799/m.24274 type:complete len:268 (+) Transcript_18799:468-1271(+)